MFYEDDESINSVHGSEECEKIDAELAKFIIDKSGFSAYLHRLDDAGVDKKNLIKRIFRVFYQDQAPAFEQVDEDVLSKTVELLMFMFFKTEAVYVEAVQTKKALYDLQSDIYLINCPARGNA